MRVLGIGLVLHGQRDLRQRASIEEHLQSVWGSGWLTRIFRSVLFQLDVGQY